MPCKNLMNYFFLVFTFSINVNQSIIYYRVEYIPFVSVISRLIPSDKNKLKEIMDSIGGIVTESFDENCTHLTMTTATMTNKVKLVKKFNLI